jgi:hypothetical protein
MLNFVMKLGKDERFATSDSCVPKLSLMNFGLLGRGERIRTSDSCVPNAVLYQAELRPDVGLWAIGLRLGILA